MIDLLEFFFATLLVGKSVKKGHFLRLFLVQSYSQSKFLLAAGSSCASIEESDFTTANLKALVDGVLV